MDSIENKYLAFFKRNDISLDAKFLIGVSGGVDSMVCLDLARKHSKNISVAHINYKLRGKESERDEQITKEYCLKWDIPFYLQVSRIDKSKNIQLEARNIRYTFYEEMLKENGLDFIITAHHLNDNVETFFLNASRGSGINGLTGIPSIRKQIIRPLAKVSKNQITDYSTKNQLKFGEDSSNKTSDYTRNFLRNKVLPLLNDQFPNFFNKIDDTILNLKRDKTLLNELVNKEINKVIHKKGNGYLINKNNTISTHTWFHFLKEFGFNYKQIINWVENDRQSGKTIFSEHYELSNDRTHWTLFPIDEEKHIEVKLKVNESIINPINLTCEITSLPSSFDKNIGYFDIEQLQFPLTVSKWKKGDKIHPLGMKGIKKISDILIDKKVSSHEKKDVWVIKSNDIIIWLVGFVVNENYKVTDKTNRCYKIKFNLR